MEGQEPQSTTHVSKIIKQQHPKNTNLVKLQETVKSIPIGCLNFIKEWEMATITHTI